MNNSLHQVALLQQMALKNAHWLRANSKLDELKTCLSDIDFCDKYKSTAKFYRAILSGQI